MKKLLAFSLFTFTFSLSLLASPATSEISVDLKLDHLDFVVGERVRGIVDVVNVSPGTISVGYRDSQDRLLIEVFRATDRSQLESISDRRFVAEFTVRSCEGQKLETFLGDHYGLRNPNHYLARPVLVHNGMRYEGKMRAFDIVPGMRIGGALQIFANRDGMQRAFDLVTWNREGEPHLFLFAHDMDSSGNRLGGRKWLTTDLGPMMKITQPTISVMPDGIVVVLHRVDPDNFIRSEFWSVSDDIVFNRRELIQDPETAGTARVREMYKESGGITPKENPWWKFW